MTQNSKCPRNVSYKIVQSFIEQLQELEHFKNKGNITIIHISLVYRGQKQHSSVLIRLSWFRSLGIFKFRANSV